MLVVILKCYIINLEDHLGERTAGHNSQSGVCVKAVTSTSRVSTKKSESSVNNSVHARASCVKWIMFFVCIVTHAQGREFADRLSGFGNKSTSLSSKNI